MAYIDTLQKVTIPVRGEPVECIAGSFKGVPFFFESTDFSGGGRNVQTNSIPFSNDHVNEDTGINVPKYSFNIYFVGEDAENQKNDFLRVCNEEGPGELIHPYFGVFKARVNAPINLSYGDYQEYISGSVTFVPENDFELKNSVVSLAATTKKKAVELRKSVADKAARSFRVTGKSKGVWDKAVEMSQKAFDAVYSARKYVQAASGFVREFGRMMANVENIMRAPKDYALRIQGLITMAAEVSGIPESTISSAIENKKNDVLEYLDMMKFDIASSSIFDNQSAENRAAIVSLVRLTGASMVAESLVDCEFSSVSEAERYQNDVHDAFEEVLEDIDDVDLFIQVQTLEAAALKHLRDNLSKIPYEVEIEIPATNNLLSLVYGVYGNLDEIDSVLERNGYRDPLFVKPSDKMVVLCHD